MSIINLLNVDIKNAAAAAFDSPYVLEITFESLEPLTKDLEWKLTYVGSATSNEHDQELDSLLVGPIPVGVNKFVFEADPPDTSRIPDAEILGVTVILLTCSYDGREFVRVGYYVNNEYDSEELNADPPAKPLLEHVRRNVLAEKPRVTRFAIKWDSDESAPAEFPPDQPEADQTADGDQYGAEEEEELELEEEDGGAATADPDAMVDDAEMGGVEADPAAAAEESDDGSEDLEAESSGSEDEGEEEEEGEGEGGEDEAMEVDGIAKPNGALEQHHADAVMAH